MKRIRRRLFIFATALSLALCVLTFAAWVGSMFESVGHITVFNGNARVIGIYRGCFAYEFIPLLNMRLQTGFIHYPLHLFGTPILDWVSWKLDWRNDSRGINLRLPLFWLWIPFGVLPSFVGVRFLIRSAHHIPETGICPACGYDLRATPLRCPECGAAGDQLIARASWGQRAVRSLTSSVVLRGSFAVFWIGVLIILCLGISLLIDDFVLDHRNGLIHATSFITRCVTVAGCFLLITMIAAVWLLLFSRIARLPSNKRRSIQY